MATFKNVTFPFQRQDIRFDIVSSLTTAYIESKVKGNTNLALRKSIDQARHEIEESERTDYPLRKAVSTVVLF